MPPPTEQTLLSRYLLPPSSLPTILPYTTFISLLPSSLASTATNDKNSITAILIKCLYRDLQFQRDIDIDTVALNIQRECQRSDVLRGRLRRQIREELGYPPLPLPTTTLALASKSNGLKRKRTADNEDNTSTQSQLSTTTDASDEDEDENSALPPTNPKPIPSKTPPPPTPTPYNPLLAPLETRLDNLFSGPRGLAPSLLPPSQRYHTTTSLLHSMQQSISHLTSEINILNTQSEHVMEGMRETVGGMSDLRYGKFARVGRSTDIKGAGDDGEGGGGGGGSGGGLEEEVVEALKELKQVVDQKTQSNWSGKGKGKGLEG